MISALNPILYACISKGTTVLADLSSGDPDLETLAFQCLEKKPDFHGFYSHTIRNRSYCFLIDDPIVYFAVVEEDFGMPHVVDFLKHLKDAFAAISKKKRIKSLDRLTYRCFQEEFGPVFCRSMHLLNPIGDQDESTGKNAGSTEAPLLGNPNRHERKKRVGMAENMVDVALDANVSRELPVLLRKNSCCAGNDGGRQQSGKTWKRHVLIVLLVDLVICLILFGVWLSICKGFRCVKR
ncbi:phytolongin Phyl1.1-like [Magnolia sinica]|uniref:phytolongin Phyl1.1-like n=1 Tax=Magnolia sinica TaxID=86752 RepID=UPI002658058B|nr:phytolongin Phyl1.1-like [Magnolia sinica]